MSVFKMMMTERMMMTLSVAVIYIKTITMSMLAINLSSYRLW